MEFLTTEYQAEEIQCQRLGGGPSGRGKKLKVMFRINSQEKAYEVYDTISSKKHFLNTDMRIQIYFLLPEKDFERYADEEAAIYYAEEKARKEREQQDQQQRKQ